MADVTGEGRKRSQLALPGSSEIVLGGHEVDLTNMIAVMKTPSGHSEPCLLKKTPTGQLSEHTMPATLTHSTDSKLHHDCFT